MYIFIYLFWTIVIECTILALILRGWRKQELLIFLLANLCSWSILHILWLHFEFNIWLLEFLVTVFEALVLFYVANLPPQKSLLYALLTNSASLGTGIIINGLP
jgi:hypothetical protein